MEFHKSEFNEGEMPEELLSLLQGLGRRLTSTGMAHDHAADDIKPSKEQFALETGDRIAITLSAGGPDVEDSPFMIGTVLDAEKHAGTYPDYMDRLAKSYLLVEYMTPSDYQTPETGWVPRARLVKLTEDMYATVYGWFVNDDPPGEMEPWMLKRYNEALDGIAEANEWMPVPLRCPECDSLAVWIDFVQTRKVKVAAGMKRTEPRKEFLFDLGSSADELPELYILTQYDQTNTFRNDLVCEDCGEVSKMSPEIKIFTQS